MNTASRTITFTVNRKTAEAFDAILNMPPKMMPDASKQEDGSWSFTSPWGSAANLKFHENRQLGILDHQVIDDEAKWNVPMRVVSKGDDSEIITTIIKPDSISEQKFDERMKEIEKIMHSMKQIIEEN